MIGVDEVGRGCLAGPLLVVAARQVSTLPKGLNDSKLLSKKQREALFGKLIEVCEFGEGWVSAKEIDNLGLSSAMRLGVKRALNYLNVGLDEQIVLDGKYNYAPKRFKVRCIIKADSKVKIVSAASVYAKVRRDNFMSELSKKYPSYGFESHVGYGTAHHLMAIRKFGPLLRIHRLSFEPLALKRV